MPYFFKLFIRNHIKLREKLLDYSKPLSNAEQDDVHNYLLNAKKCKHTWSGTYALILVYLPNHALVSSLNLSNINPTHPQTLEGGGGGGGRKGGGAAGRVVVVLAVAVPAVVVVFFLIIIHMYVIHSKI